MKSKPLIFLLNKQSRCWWFETPEHAYDVNAMVMPCVRGWQQNNRAIVVFAEAYNWRCHWLDSPSGLDERNFPVIMTPLTYSRDHSVYAPSHWETALLCNAVSHWLDAYTVWSLIQYVPQTLNIVLLCFVLYGYCPRSYQTNLVCYFDLV